MPEKKQTKKKKTAHLFKPGNPGGPGRQKGSKSYSAALRKILGGKNIKVEWEIDKPDGMGGFTTVKKRLHVKATQDMYYGIAAAQIMEALKGDTVAAREIIDRVEGKVKQDLKIESETPIQRLKIGGSIIDFH